MTFESGSTVCRSQELDNRVSRQILKLAEVAKFSKNQYHKSVSLWGHFLCCDALLQSTAERSDSVAAEWNQLVDTYARGVHYNGLALKRARQGDFHAAARIWLRASRGCSCNAKILFNLAICYQNGLGVTKDLRTVNCRDSLANCDRFLAHLAEFIA